MNFDIVVIGGSLGGFRALETILEGIPDDYPLPIVMVLHRSSDSDDTLVRLLRDRARLKVKEAEDKDAIAPGYLYVAPPDYHLLVEHHHLALSTLGPVNSARPSIDVLFESTADAYRRRAIAVLLSGSSNDGAQGIATVKAHGGFAVIQEPASAESRIMPDAALALTQVDKVLPLSEIAECLRDLIT